MGVFVGWGGVGGGGGGGGGGGLTKGLLLKVAPTFFVVSSLNLERKICHSKCCFVAVVVDAANIGLKTTLMAVTIGIAAI